MWSVIANDTRHRMPEIACLKPAVGGKGVHVQGAVPIAYELVEAPGDDLAVDAGRYVGTVVADDAYLRIAHRASACRRCPCRRRVVV